MKAWLLALSLTFSSSGLMAVEIRQFDDPHKQARYESLIEELRCLVCQNQSLADSDAELAKDLRDEVYGIIQSGQSEEEAIRFLTDRYGDFVLYRPPLKPITILLWVGPLLMLLAGSFVLWSQHRRRQTEPDVTLSNSEHQQLEALRKKLNH